MGAFVDAMVVAYSLDDGYRKYVMERNLFGSAAPVRDLAYEVSLLQRMLRSLPESHTLRYMLPVLQDLELPRGAIMLPY